MISWEDTIKADLLEVPSAKKIYAPIESLNMEEPFVFEMHCQKFFGIRGSGSCYDWVEVSEEFYEAFCKEFSNEASVQDESSEK